MNGIPRRRSEPVDLEELGRLLPTPADPHLPSDRHHLLREHLMSEIQQDGTTSQARRPHRTRRRVALAVAPVAVAAAAAVAVLAVTGLAGAGHQAPPVGAGGSGGTSPTTGTGPTPTTAVLLDRVALAADVTTVAPRPDQFVYVDSKVSFSNTSTDANGHDKVVMEPVHRRQVWVSVDGSQAGWLVEPGTLAHLPADGVRMDPVPDPDIAEPTYQYLTTLPTDPDQLLALLHAKITSTGIGGVDKPGGGVGLDQETFRIIGDVIRENLVPPKLSAALYRAAAKIPGVTVLPDVTDAAGRHGLAVSRTGNDGTRMEWIFDWKTYTYLGERDDNLKTGTPVGLTAVLSRGVVDHVKQLPK